MWVHSVDCHPYHDYIIMILSMWADAIHFDLCTVWSWITNHAIRAGEEDMLTLLTWCVSCIPCARLVQGVFGLKHAIRKQNT